MRVREDVARLLDDVHGGTAIEYGLIAFIVSLAGAAALSQLGGYVDGSLQSALALMNSAGG